MADLFLFNTLTQTKEKFIPLQLDAVSLYSCGPTVYDHPTIGNMRSYVLSDLIRKTLEYNGYQVRQVINITDVGHLTSDADEGEDKIEKTAKTSGQSVAEFTALYTNAFFQDLANLHIETSDTLFPRASSDHNIQKQIELITTLEQKGFTYQITDGIYFDTSKFAGYELLGRLNLSGQKSGARVEENIEKKNPTDFALWKFSKPAGSRLQEWTSPWGVGFPGWHIECSAMSMDLLGPTIDIHSGGEDHITVHHTNERAQSESATGQTFVNYWLHNAFITVDGAKMSKSKNNFYTLNDLVTHNIHPLAYRLWLLMGSYHSPLNFTWQTLEGVQKSWEKINKQVQSYPDGGEIDEAYQQKFISYINDDLNTAKAVALIQEILTSTLPEASKKATILEFDKILSILDLSFTTSTSQAITPEIALLIKQRNLARQNKDWATADKLRSELQNLGYTAND